MILLVALLAAPGGPASGIDVLETRLEGSRVPGGDVHARVEIRVRLQDPGATSLPFRVLEIRGCSIDVESITALEGTRPLVTRLDSSRPPLLRGQVEIAPWDGTPGTGATAERVVTFHYLVNQPEARPGALEVSIPIVIVGDGQGAAREGAFSGRLLLTEEDSGVVFESFPSNGARGADGRSYDWKLPLVPSFVAVGAPPSGTGPILAPLLRAGFSFWGLFAVCAAVVCLYATWMMRCERRSQS